MVGSSWGLQGGDGLARCRFWLSVGAGKRLRHVQQLADFCDAVTELPDILVIDTGHVNASSSDDVNGILAAQLVHL